jgi:hypothetical protein
MIEASSNEKTSVDVLDLKQFGVITDRIKYHLDSASKAYDSLSVLRKEIEQNTHVKMGFYP